MDAFSGKSVEVCREGGNEGLTFTGLHLGDTAVVKDDSSEDLNRIGFQTEDTVGCLTAGGEGVGQNIVESLAVGKTFFQRGGDVAKFIIGHSLILLVQSKYLILDGGHFFDLLRRVVKKIFEKSHEIVAPSLRYNL